jgi:hypothetical protein
LFSVDELSYIAMERCKTSRCAVQTMGDLAVQHGFYGAGDYSEGSSESLLVKSLQIVTALKSHHTITSNLKPQTTGADCPSDLRPGARWRRGVYLPRHA